MTDSVPLRIHLNFPALRSKLNHRLTLAYQRVAAGLATSKRIEPADLVLPDAKIRLGWADHDHPSLEQLQDDYRSWVLENGFRDAVEAVHLFLDEVRPIAAVLSISTQHEVSGRELDTLMSGDQQKFHRMGFPEKFEILAETWNVSVPEFARDAALACNAARNCLVHRGGRVALKDCNTHDALEVRWRRLAVVLKGEDGERELQVGDHVNDGGVGIRFVEEHRRFELGERVLFNSREFSEIAFTLMFISDSIVRQLEQRAAGQVSTLPGPRRDGSPR